jgi:GntR family transcriptional regulator
MADPMWRQIAESLREKIESGEVGANGKPLPSELELREQYDASRNTVRDAIRWLATRGLVVTRPGQGTFVVKKIDPFVTPLPSEIKEGRGDESIDYVGDVTARSRRPTTSAPRVEVQQAEGVVADELRLALGDTVISRHQQRFIDGTPFSLQTTFYPKSLMDSGADDLFIAKDIPDGAVAYIEKKLGYKQVGWRERITVRTPNATEASFFSLPDDGRIAVFELIRTGYDQDGNPFRATVTTYPADRNQFMIEVGQVPANQGAPTPADGRDSDQSAD